MGGRPSQFVQGPGRSSATLLEDLTVYDPRRQPLPNRRILSDHPLNFIGGETLKNLLPPDSCKHEFWLKPRQSNLPQLDERPDSETIWKVAALCRICRLHVQLRVDYTNDFQVQSQPCPNAERPLHHLVRTGWRESIAKDQWKELHPGNICELFIYECSARSCPAIVSILLTPTEIVDQVVATLTDKQQLRARTDAAFKLHEANTQGMRYPAPIEVLNDLRIYMKNAWDKDPTKKSIKLSNRRFMVRFGPGGEPCRQVLESLNFRLDGENECWHVPEPIEEDLPLENPHNMVLDDLEFELLALVVERPHEERHLVHDLPRPAAAHREFERVLGCQDYDKHSSSRTLINSPYVRPAPFSGLGVPEAASDSLVQHFYHHQVNGDPDNAPQYLQLMKMIAQQRDSDPLQTELVLEESKGRYDLDMLDQAYRYFGLDVRDNSFDDDYLIGIFSSRLEDMRSHEQQMRMFLRIVGQHRKSQKIIEFADNTLNTYEQALQHLGADANYSDEAIQAVFAVKVEEHRENAQKAVTIIAKHRRSQSLQKWVDANFVHDMPMDAAEGYSALQIQDRTCDDDLIISAYDVAIIDNPDSREYYTRALQAIEKDRDSSLLKFRLQQDGVQPIASSLDEPVGLENIGNTCYLNSLLQFLFTMKQLRNIVLDFNKYKMIDNEEAFQQKKVGQRQITRKEVQHSTNFVEQLSVLFNEMVTASQSKVRPKRELARLTLETDNAKEKYRRHSTLVGDRPSLGHLDSQTYPGPLRLPEPQINGITPEAVVQSPGKVEKSEKSLDRELQDAADDPDLPDLVDMNDISSEATLVSRPESVDTPAIEIPDQQAILDNKENLSPTKVDGSPKFGDVEADHPMPLAPASPSKINAQAGALLKKESEIEHEPLPEPQYAPPPGKPPPVPPRNPPDQQSILEAYAHQQDVTEVLSHCFFQFSCAMRPTGVDESGEQQDEIHDMFFGQNVTHTVPQKDLPTKIQFYSIITRVSSEPKDVYEAIDTEYDLSVREGGSQAFLSMSKPPPVFSIALDRVTWDTVAKGAKKLNHHVEIPTTIFLDRYLEAPAQSDLFSRRQQAWELKQKLSKLKNRLKILEASHAGAPNLPALYEELRLSLEHLQVNDNNDPKFGGSLNIDPTTISAVASLADSLRSELETLKADIVKLNNTLNDTFTDSLFRQHPYQLHAAFFHRGQAGSGHYWIYIYDHLKEEWRKYNDETVTQVKDINEIFKKPDSGPGLANPANPYFLVYVQQDKIGEIVETVKREPIIVSEEDARPPLPERQPRSQLDAFPPIPEEPNGNYYTQPGSYDPNATLTATGDDDRLARELQEQQYQDDVEMQEMQHVKPLGTGSATEEQSSDGTKKPTWNNSELPGSRNVRW